MKKFFTNLKNALTSSDFWMHVFMCGIVAVFVATILVHLSIGVPAPAILGSFFAGVFCGLGKEYGDYRAKDNTWSWTDVIGDVLGAAIGCQIGWAALGL